MANGKKIITQGLRTREAQRGGQFILIACRAWLGNMPDLAVCWF